MASEVAPVFGHGFAEKLQDCGSKFGLRWVTSVVGDVAVHDGPEALYRCAARHVYMPESGVEMRAVGRQLDQVDAAGFARQKHSDIRPL